MSSPDSPAPDAQPPVAHPPGDGAALPGVLADAARALAAAPADADDAVLLAIVGEAIVPALGDVVTLYAGDGRPIGVAPVDVPLGLAAEIVAPLGDAMTDGLLAIGSSDATRRYAEAERSAADVIAAILGARRAARRQATREATLHQQLEALALAGRELAHALNNDLTMPVGVVELLMDRSDFSPDLREMLQAASKDLAALEQHVREFHLLMRTQAGQPG